ncbi:uncharacterized protein LOC114855224 [Betta splendens]|uniref:Uncharacterized protein LOC114855224 n=1 Tax=Betta splendens TaxID=158456 RepID=A0A6P7MHP0_BETSP|nr:uncharacterized protein LOC114855224 [Betta splendens]
MGGLHIVLAVLLGQVSCSHGQMFGSVVEVTVKPGDNFTLYCDCKVATGVYIVWFRNSYNENKPTLIMKTFQRKNYNPDGTNYLMSILNFHFVRNSSSNSYDLLIKDFTDSNEGLYYCGTEESKVEDEEYITQKLIYNYGNITRLICNSSLQVPHDERQQGCGSCWTLLFALCPVFAIFSCLLTSLVVYYRCQNKVGKVNQQLDTGGQTRQNQEGDLCYAALEIRQPSQRPRTKNRKSSDFSTYAAINTSSL